MITGRLGLEAARIPYADRHGPAVVVAGNLTVEDGTLHFPTVGSPDMNAGDHAISRRYTTCVAFPAHVGVDRRML